MARRTLPLLAVLLLALIFAPGLAAQAAGEPGPAPSSGGDAVLYAAVAEALLARDYAAATSALEALSRDWPSSPYLVKAEALVQRYGKKRDNSGLVTFYMGGLASGLGASALIPTSLGANLSDPAALGALYLAGAGSGMLASWLMSRDGDFTLAQDLWIESIEGLSLLNWTSLYSAWVPDTSPAAYDPSYVPAVIPTRDRVMAAGSLGFMVGSRALVWSLVRDQKPWLGRVVMATQASAWAAFYSGMIQGEILQISDQRIVTTVNMAASDLSYIGGALLWNDLGWGAFRSGLVTVGGISGVLVAVSLNMIADGLAPGLDNRLKSGFNIAGALAGQALAVWFTRSFENEVQPPPGLRFGLAPAFQAGRPALALNLGLSY